MGVISEYNKNYFKDSGFLFSKVKRFLSSYDAANLVDEGEFPTYVKEILRRLGIGVYKEDEAIINIKNHRGCLPDNFDVLYAAYKCTPSIGSKETSHLQNTISVYNDITWEVLQVGKDCTIECDPKILEKITVRQYVKEKAVDLTLSNPCLLRLSPNVKKDMCTADCQNLLCSSPYEITINDGKIHTNFSEDVIYMKYYSLPLVNGLPEIPDIEEVEKTLEWYIIHQVLLKLWMNGEVPDLERKVAEAERKFNEAYAEAKYLIKTPSFTQMVNYLRRQRAVNKVVFFAQQG